MLLGSLVVAMGLGFVSDASLLSERTGLPGDAPRSARLLAQADMAEAPPSAVAPPAPDASTATRIADLNTRIHLLKASRHGLALPVVFIVAGSAAVIPGAILLGIGLVSSMGLIELAGPLLVLGGLLFVAGAVFVILGIVNIARRAKRNAPIDEQIHAMEEERRQLQAQPISEQWAPVPSMTVATF